MAVVMVQMVVVDVVVVVVGSILVGAVAPRWPSRWLATDIGPLMLLPWESAPFYRRLGVGRLGRKLPELGETFGGTSKSSIPGVTPAALSAYLIEVRRAEWVHWLSIGISLMLFLINPWWLAVAFVIVVTVGNTPFILVLRNNRLRIDRILTRHANGRPL